MPIHDQQHKSDADRPGNTHAEAVVGEKSDSSDGARVSQEKRGLASDNRHASFPPTHPKRPVVESTHLAWWAASVDSLPSPFNWVKPHLKSSDSWKKVFRVAISAWSGLIIGWLINPVRLDIGNVFYVTTLIAFLIAPSEPFASGLQKSIVQLFILAIAYTWVCFMYWIAWLARGPGRLTQSEFQAQIVRQLTQEGVPPADFPAQISLLLFGGTYIDWKANAVFLVFSSFGASVLLWYKANCNPIKGSLLPIPIVMVAIGAIIGHYIPYPAYVSIATTIFYPAMLQMGVNLFWSAVFFPESRQHQFIGSLVAALHSFRKVLSIQKGLLAVNPASEEWHEAGSGMKPAIDAMARMLAMLRLTMGSLDLEVSPRELNADDVRELFTNIRFLGARAFGIQRFYNIVAMHIHRQGEDNTTTNLVVRLGGKDNLGIVHTDEKEQGKEGFAATKHSHQFKNHLAHALHRDVILQPVGLHESQQYALLEEKLSAGEDVQKIVDLVALLHDASDDILSAMLEAIDHLIATLARMSSAGVLSKVFGKPWDRAAIAKRHSEIRGYLKEAMNDYSTKRRVELAQPFAPLFEHVDMLSDPSYTVGMPTRRGFFWCCQYVHSLLRVADGIDVLLAQAEKLDAERTRLKFWLPKWVNWHVFGQDSSEPNGFEEAPEDIPGLRDLSHPIMRPRNPDFLPPTSTTQLIGEALHACAHRMSKPDVIYAIKAAPLLALLGLISYFRSTAQFAYENRIVWVVITTAIAFSPYLGDTAFQFVWRLILTWVAVVLGMVIWYIGNGHGDGNPYGFAIVLAFAFIPLSFFATYYPVPSQWYILLLSCVMPLGYDWRSGHTTDPLTSFAAPGWEVAYRRYLCIAVAVTASFIWSWVPPALASQKEQIRLTHAKTVREIGVLFTGCVNYATLPDSQRPTRPKRIIGNALAIRAKLMSTVPRKVFARYEVSLRGAWPEKSYDKLLEHQLELCDLLSQLAGIVGNLPRPWINALLARTHLDDPRFLADITASITLVSSSLRDGTAMPAAHTTLLATAYRDHVSDRINSYDLPGDSVKGLDGETSAVPRHVNINTLIDPNYQRFATAVSTIFGALNRLDSLVAVTKELCGELYTFYSLDHGHTESRDHLLAVYDGANAV